MEQKEFNPGLYHYNQLFQTIFLVHPSNFVSFIVLHTFIIGSHDKSQHSVRQPLPVIAFIVSDKTFVLITDNDLLQLDLRET